MRVSELSSISDMRHLSRNNLAMTKNLLNMNSYINNEKDIRLYYKLLYAELILNLH